MSIVFSKNKNKRSRSTSVEANNSSFVKNVTSRMTGLLPAAVTKWFSSPSSSSNANGSTQTADATDSSTEDEAPESPVAAQPPSKRMRLASPASYNHYVASELNCLPSTLEQSEIEAPSPYSTVQSPPGRTTFRRETNYVSTPIRLDASTPVRSEDEAADRDSTLFKSQHSVSTTGPTVAMKRKSLFDSPGRAEASKRACVKTADNVFRDPNAPCFKPSLLGSPFYPGQTAYGGAATLYINRPNIKQRTNTFVNESNTTDNTVSHSTRRIMDLLENFSSPLSDARRIPHYTRTPRDTSLSSSLSSTSPPSNKVMSYKTQELHVPSIASILRLKQRSRLLDTTTVARQLIASHSSTLDFVPYSAPNISTQREKEDKESGSKMTTKVKTKLTRQKRGGGSEAETEMPTPVSLPSAVLNIDRDNLPTFSFAPATATATATAPAPAATTTALTPNKDKDQTPSKITETPLRKPDIVTSSQAPYKFSSPVRISKDEAQSQNSTELPKFTFGSPDRSVDKVNEKKNDDISCVVGAPKQPDNKLTAKKTNDWQCPDCWVSNKTTVDVCVCCGGKKPSGDAKKPAKCTVCKLADSQTDKDKCVNCEKMQSATSNMPTLNKKDDTAKWKCGDCWVNNNEGVDKCVCCGASNPKKAATTAPKQNAVVNDKDSEWKCDDCWIKNKSSVDKCAACGASKPGTKTNAPASFNLPKPIENAFKTIPKPQPDKWECTICLVRNDGNRSRCVCCEAERPGSISEADKTSFNFGSNKNTFKFGIPAAAQETPKPTEEPATTFGSKKEESETNNNVLPKTPTFTFGLPSKKPEDQTDSAKKAEEKSEKPDAPKMNFSFGIPKSAGVTAPTTTPQLMFGMPSKPAEPVKAPEETKEKLQEVPKIDFGIPATKPQTSQPPPSIFGSPVASTSAASENAAVVPSLVLPEKPQMTLMFNPPSTAKKDLASTLTMPAASTAPAVTSAPAPAPAPAAAPAPSFSFGSGGGLRISSNLFSAPTTTTAPAPVMFGSTSMSTSNSSPFEQKNEPAASTSAMSLFSKSETTSTVSLFAKAETTASAAPSAAAPAPLFSFGGSAQSAQPQPEKPQFNFSFGSANKTETSMFSAPKPAENKFTFGVTSDNKFTLPSSNALGGSSTLGGNGLSTGTNLGGNGLSANPLAGATSPLGGSGLQTNSMQAPSGGIFGAAPAQKDNSWSFPNANNSTNIFGSNTASSTPMQKPAFTFGSSTTMFNANSPAPPAFGASAQQPSGNIFGMNTGTAASQPSMFSSPPAGQSVFGSPQQNAPAFGSPSVGATPAFGSPNASIPTFEAPSLTPAPAPAFNFGASVQQTPGVFGFGQQAQPGGFNFGAPAAGASPVQFNMGSAPNTAMRRVRKAVRRNTPR